MFSSRKPQTAARPHLALADIDTGLDEWAAMREVYEALTGFDERAQTRIVEAVRTRLADELDARRYAENQARLERDVTESV